MECAPNHSHERSLNSVAVSDDAAGSTTDARVVGNSSIAGSDFRPGSPSNASTTTVGGGSPATGSREGWGSGNNAGNASASRRGGAPAVDEANLIVNFIPVEVTEGELRQLFAQFGRVVQSRIIVDANGGSKGYGFVRFARPEDAARSMEALDGFAIYGKTLKVSVARPNNASTQLAANAIDLSSPMMMQMSAMMLNWQRMAAMQQQQQQTGTTSGAGGAVGSSGGGGGGGGNGAPASGPGGSAVAGSRLVLKSDAPTAHEQLMKAAPPSPQAGPLPPHGSPQAGGEATLGPAQQLHPHQHPHPHPPLQQVPQQIFFAQQPPFAGPAQAPAPFMQVVQVPPPAQQQQQQQEMHFYYQPQSALPTTLQPSGFYHVPGNPVFGSAPPLHPFPFGAQQTPSFPQMQSVGGAPAPGQQVVYYGAPPPPQQHPQQHPQQQQQQHFAFVHSAGGNGVAVQPVHSQHPAMFSSGAHYGAF